MDGKASLPDSEVDRLRMELEQTRKALRQTQSVYFESLATLQRLKIAFLNAADVNPSVPEKQLPSVLINAVPKTGGLYIYRTLAAGLNFTPFEICLNVFPGAALDHRRVSLFKLGNCICHHHLDPSDFNVWHLKRNDMPMMFHTRDLRSVMLSWMHHLTASGNAASMGGHALIAPKQEYFERPVEWRMDWVIDTQLRVYVDLMKGWLRAIDAGEVKAIVTRYEDFIADRQAFFAKVTDFFQVSDAFRDPQLVASRGLNLRSGNPEEWRSVMNKAQIAKINAGIPSDWWRRFSWKA